MFRNAEEAGKEAEHAEAEGKKLEELHRRISEAQATPYHTALLQVYPFLALTNLSNVFCPVKGTKSVIFMCLVRFFSMWYIFLKLAYMYEKGF